MLVLSFTWQKYITNVQLTVNSNGNNRPSSLNRSILHKNSLIKNGISVHQCIAEHVLNNNSPF